MPPRRFRLALVWALALAGCSKPLPPEKSAHAGEWSGAGMTLRLTPEGKLSYRRVEGASRRTINAPLKEFQGDNFVVVVGPMVTTFVVSAPPRRAGALWRMTADGVELTRAR